MCKLLCGHVFSMILGTGLKVELLGKSGFKVLELSNCFSKGLDHLAFLPEQKEGSNSFQSR